MLVYHGSVLEIKNPEIIRTEYGRDFGFAFYTTDIKEQAERWAIRKAKIQNRRKNQKVMLVVNVYKWNKICLSLNIKDFNRASMEWLDMVLSCRININFVHNYDIVTGKIANDNVGETVSYVMQGVMRKEDAIERLKFEKINNQIAFCTPKSLETLQFIESYTVR